MKVWRIEHKCSAPHGPLGVCPDSKGWLQDVRIAYGARLEPPQSDPLMERFPVEPHHIFGTFPDQFPKWWSNDEVPTKLPEKWFACIYEVEDEAAVVGTNQVMFDSYRAIEVYKTQQGFPR